MKYTIQSSCSHHDPQDLDLIFSRRGRVTVSRNHYLYIVASIPIYLYIIYNYRSTTQQIPNPSSSDDVRSKEKHTIQSSCSHHDPQDLTRRGSSNSFKKSLSSINLSIRVLLQQTNPNPKSFC